MHAYMHACMRKYNNYIHAYIPRGGAADAAAFNTAALVAAGD